MLLKVEDVVNRNQMSDEDLQTVRGILLREAEANMSTNAWMRFWETFGIIGLLALGNEFFGWIIIAVNRYEYASALILGVLTLGIVFGVYSVIKALYENIRYNPAKSYLEAVKGNNFLTADVDIVEYDYIRSSTGNLGRYLVKIGTDQGIIEGNFLLRYYGDFKKGKGILVVVETVNPKTKEKERVWRRVIPTRSHSESTYKKALKYCVKYDTKETM